MASLRFSSEIAQGGFSLGLNYHLRSAPPSLHIEPTYIETECVLDIVIPLGGALTKIFFRVFSTIAVEIGTCSYSIVASLFRRVF